MHVAPAPLGGSDEGRRRHRASGVAPAEAEEEEDVRSCRRRSCQPEMSDHGCIHLNNFKAAKGIQPYKVIHAYFVTSTSTDARVRKVCSLIVLFFPPRAIRGQGSRDLSLLFPVTCLSLVRARSFARIRALSRALSLPEELERVPPPSTAAPLTPRAPS